eukprot:Ihof_evm10s104 gene=Ihof_evmTU10s104
MQLLSLLLLALVPLISCTELTFEMEPNELSCFNENVKDGQTMTLEYQVVYGGQVGSLDVNVYIRSPLGEFLYQKYKKSFDDVEIKASVAGTYQVCFSNKMSTISHKTVYFDLFLDEGVEPLQEDPHVATAITRLGDSSKKIHHSLRKIVDAQTHQRVNEISGRLMADNLEYNITIWSAFQSTTMIILSVIQ